MATSSMFDAVPPPVPEVVAVADDLAGGGDQVLEPVVALVALGTGGRRPTSGVRYSRPSAR